MIEVAYLMVSLPCTGPAGSKRVKVNASTYSSSGTPYCRPSEIAIAKLFISERKRRAFLVHVDEDLAEPAVLVFAGAQVHLVAADDGLLGVALAAVGQLLALAQHGDALDDLLDHALGGNRGARRVRLVDDAASIGVVLILLVGDELALSGWLSFEPSR